MATDTIIVWEFSRAGVEATSVTVGIFVGGTEVEVGKAVEIAASVSNGRVWMVAWDGLQATSVTNIEINKILFIFSPSPLDHVQIKLGEYSYSFKTALLQILLA